MGFPTMLTASHRPYYYKTSKQQGNRPKADHLVYVQCQICPAPPIIVFWFECQICDTSRMPRQYWPKSPTRRCKTHLVCQVCNDGMKFSSKPIEGERP